MSKIFQLELFVQEMKLWNLATSKEVAEISIDVTVFDCKDVPIKRHHSAGNDKNAPMSRGQNFLFTLDEMPKDENQVFFNVFRNTNEKKLVGKGNIPILDLFGDVFMETFKQPEITEEPEIVQQPEESDQGKANDINASKSKTNSKTAQSRKSTGNTTKKGPTSSGTANMGKNQQQAEKSDPTKNDAPSEEVAVGNTAKPIAPPFNPISKLTKDIYPIIGTDSNQCGIVCILMRLTSFGNFNAHPIHIHQNHKEIIIQNTQNTALYRRLPLDELRKNKHSEDLRFISAFPNNAGKEELIYNRAPEVMDFNYQCNEKEIVEDTRQVKT